MKICVVIDDYLPDSTRVGAKMMHELCQEFARRGHSVTVVAPQSGSPRVETSILDGVHLRRFPAGATKNVPKWRRALNESLLPWRAWLADGAWLRANRHDLIVYYSPCIFWGPLVSRLKRAWKARSFLVLRDFFPQWAIDNGMLQEGSPVTRYFRWCEASTYLHADLIGIQSPRNLEAFRAAHPRAGDLTLLYNWAEDRPSKPMEPSYRQRLGLEGKVVFFYGGAITNQQDIPNLLRLAERLLPRRDAHFLIVGEGYDLPKVRAIVEARDLCNVTLHPTVSQEEFRRMLAEVDIGLFSLAACHTTHNFPGKVLGYLVQGLPVLGSVNPGNDLQAVINDAGAGFVHVNGEDESLERSARVLLDNLAERREAGLAARRLLGSTFSVSSAATVIETAIRTGKTA